MTRAIERMKQILILTAFSVLLGLIAGHGYAAVIGRLWGRILEAMP